MFTKNIKSVLFLSKPMEIDNLFKTWIHSGNYFFATKPLNHKESLKRIGYLSTFCAIWRFRDFVAFFLDSNMECLTAINHNQLTTINNQLKR